MKEDFLHYIWKFKKFSSENLKTTDGDTVEIISLGNHNTNAGPDFLNAQIVIGGQHWAGNVEIHEKSSLWYAHHHEKDVAYNNVILHVVWEFDVAIFNSQSAVIPTLVLKDLVHKDTLTTYRNLIFQQQTFVNCEHQLKSVDEFLKKHWLERLYVERLHDKSRAITSILETLNYDWEAVLYTMLLKNFGLKVNAEAFLQLSQLLPFEVVRKNKTSLESLEALFFGVSNMFPETSVDAYVVKLQNEFRYLKQKYKLKTANIPPAYFKLRPPNFPTIRLSQLASLYGKESSLFQQLMEVSSAEKYYEIFNVSASEYWNNHFTFEKTSPSVSVKKMSRPFIDLLIINTILPLKFCYFNARGKDVSEEIINVVSELKKEHNNIVSSFEKFNFKAENALDTQAQIQLYTQYCSLNKCLQCEIGVKLING
ncbi:DUF2851 family protein [Joostella sp. CR20]|uniref:DUF2851 family protein n=1 Tax=Joostella sp. CR20 TaxID=2804312 RepID=UPI00313D283C